jgi:hypothetical protein
MVFSTRLFSLLLLLALAIAPSAAFAQIEEDTTTWNDSELYEDEAVEAAPYFAVGGGPMVGLFMPNLDAFNKNIAQPFVGQDISNSVLMVGGQGFISVPWVKNLRVGGMGYGGRTEQCCVETSVDSGLRTVSRTLEYNVGYGAVTIDYVLPLNLGKFNIVPGIAIGVGSVEVYAQQAAQRNEFDIRKEFDFLSSNITHNYHSTFFLYMPQIQFEYSFGGFMMTRLSVGYQGTAMGEWEVDRGVGITNSGQLDDINGSGLIANVGFFFGLFP